MTAAKQAGIDLAKLKKEFSELTRFIYVLNHSIASKSWYDFCKEEREGRQDLEELSKLISSSMRVGGV